MSRIAFVTGRIVRGTDGVGDYSHLMTDQLQAMGHECLIVGLKQGLLPNESKTWLEPATYSGFQLGSSPPALDAWQNRLNMARDAIRLMDPDVVSFQYVSFSYARRGLTWNTGREFRKIVGDRRVELNAHELWTGFDLAANFQSRMMGALQRKLFQRFVRQLGPDVIHVSNPTYVEMLRQIGLKANMSPLFGNIPVTDRKPAHGQFEGFDDSPSDCWRFLFFGSIHGIWPPEPLMSRIISVAEQQKRKPVIISVGRIGPGLGVWNWMEQNYQGRCQFVRLGERSGEEVSKIINGVDFGISTTPLCLIGKSGTVAAMLEHGLPVIVNREYPLRNIPEIEPAEGFHRFIRLNDMFSQNLVEASGKPRVRLARLPETAHQFLRDTGLAMA